MSKAHRLKIREQKPATKSLPLNFLLGCSQPSLENFELARINEVANLRTELHAIMDRVIDAMSQAALASWFRSQDRNALKHAIENEETPEEWARRMIRNRGRSKEEIGEDGYLIPRPSLPPGAAHLAAALRYEERNIAEGKCGKCPQPLARNSVRYCEKHLTAARLRMTPSKGKPGSVGWLYGETEESSHGRQPGTLASLAMNREKKTRAILAELGVPLESAATATQAAKAALMEHMPRSKKDALMIWELFDNAGLSDLGEGTAKKALQELFAAGLVQRIGKGAKGDPFLYFKRDA